MKHSSAVRVIYDETCFFCRNLALFLSYWNSEMCFVSKKEYDPEKKTGVLYVEDLSQGHFYEDEEAWVFLSLRFPMLKQIQWMAYKMGWDKKIVGKTLKKSMEHMRTFCKKCD